MSTITCGPDHRRLAVFAVLPLSLVSILLPLPARAQAQNDQTAAKTQDATTQEKIQNALALIQKVAKAEPRTVQVHEIGTRDGAAEREYVHNHGLTQLKQDQEGIATFGTGQEKSSKEFVTLRLSWLPSMNNSVWNNDQTGKTKNNEEFSISGPVGDKFVTIRAIRNSDHLDYDEGLVGLSGVGAGKLKDDVKGGVGHIKNIFHKGSSQSDESAPPPVEGRQVYDHQVVDAFYTQLAYYMDLFKANGLDKDAPPVRGDAYKKIPRPSEAAGQK